MPVERIDQAAARQASPGPSDLPSQQDLGFFPDGRRAARLDREIRADLGESLAHLGSLCAGAVPHDPDALQRMISGLRGGARYGPAAYALYTELVFALLQDERSRAGRLFAELTALEPQSEPCRILPLDDPAIASHRERFLTLLALEGTAPPTLAVPEGGELAPFLADLRWAMERMDCALPELAAEIRSVVAQLILLWVPAAPDQLVFDGGSSPMLWGGLFINVARRRTPLELLEVLVHESAHLLLYAFSQHEPLVLNGEEERYPSPLRTDPRPMEGIFHATWVSARMAYAMDTLARCGELDGVLRLQALEAMEADRANFRAGHAVICPHARLTSTGRRLIEAAAAALEPTGGSGQ